MPNKTQQGKLYHKKQKMQARAQTICNSDHLYNITGRKSKSNKTVTKTPVILHKTPFILLCNPTKKRFHSQKVLTAHTVTIYN